MPFQSLSHPVLNCAESVVFVVQIFDSGQDHQEPGELHINLHGSRPSTGPSSEQVRKLTSRSTWTIAALFPKFRSSSNTLKLLASALQVNC